MAPVLSVVIPTFDSAPYLPSTLDACVEALNRCGWSAEILVIDDGSTDGSGDVARAWGRESPVDVQVVRTRNQGRFLARWTGLQTARGGLVLLLDSRVLLAPTSLEHLRRCVEREAEDVVPVWNGHAVTDPTAPLVGLFWEVPVHVFWGDYLSNPRPVVYGLADFNRYPKGTGAFLTRRSVLVEACEAVWPTADAALVSDDTKLIRYIAARHPVRLDPGFLVVYRPRTDAHAFVRHSFGRGTFLVDSFGGTSRTWTALLLALAVAPLFGLALLVLAVALRSWPALSAVVALATLAVAAPAALAVARHCSRRAVMAFVLYLPLFVIPYWCGLVRGLVVHRGTLRPPTSAL